MGDMFPIRYDDDAHFGELTPWAVGANQWVHFACYSSPTGGDMLGIINTAPDKWDHIAYSMLPGESWKLVQNPHAFFTFRRAKNVPVTTWHTCSIGVATGHLKKATRPIPI